MVKGILFLEYIDEETCSLSGMMNIDPNFSYIPSFVFNYLMRRIVYNTLCKLSEKDYYENDEV